MLPCDNQIEWPFNQSLDSSYVWRDKPYEERMELIMFWCQEIAHVLDQE